MLWLLNLNRDQFRQTAALSLIFHPDYIKKFCDPSEILHVEEEIIHNSFVSDKRKRDFLSGRYCAKMALTKLDASIIEISDICISSGVFRQPLIKFPKCNYQVSISHTDTCAIALVFPDEQPMGIDIENINLTNEKAIRTHFTLLENQITINYEKQIQGLITLLWVAKESLSKVLKTGLTLSLPLLEIAAIDVKDNHYIVQYSHFTQYKSVVFSHDNMYVAISLPKKTDISFLRSN